MTSYRYETWEEEIAAIENAVLKERELERESFQNSKKNAKLAKTIKSLSLEDQTYSSGEVWKLHLTATHSLSENSWMRQGTPVILESGEFSLVSQVYQIKDKTIILQYKGEKDIPEDESFTLSQWYSESTYDAYLEAIRNLRKKEERDAKDISSWILGYAQNEKPSSPKNKEEASPLEKVLNLRDYGFIYGPPGTGKTTLLVSAVKTWSNEKKSILALAPTNFACDYLVESSAKEGLHPIRLGSSSKIRESVQKYLLDVQLESSLENKQIQVWRREWRDLKKKAGAWKRNFGAEEREERKQLHSEAKSLLKSIDTLQKNTKEKILRDADLIVSTFLGAWHLYEEGKKFDYVIVDEATQAWESACYMAILLGKTVLFAGDPKQLPPTLSDENSILSHSFLEKGIERDDGTRTVFLDTQYRMPEEIVRFSNQEFYESKLKTKSEKSPFLDPEVETIFQSDKKLIWIDTAGSDAEEESNDEDESLYNKTEIDLILSLLKSNLDFSKTAILSPYRKQVEVLEAQVRKEFPDAEILPIIQTIDSFQGRESETVILSFVRTNDEGELGFLKDYRRLNVGLTRAKSNLILIGNSVTLTGDKTYRRLYDLVEAAGEHKSIFEFLY
ncbi:AAA domain-containing protein [Leptospira idonii]|uniref:RNA helicase n=1 Tax=Leptospira idonii TaxID=1193500 RepID=A0A4R9M4A5_9LEPT|nr:AAA domain-containing protein [Leptospira idonii]TGN20089.1 RNA helicase [Leptospira idonii]